SVGGGRNQPARWRKRKPGSAVIAEDLESGNGPVSTPQKQAQRAPIAVGSGRVRQDLGTGALSLSHEIDRRTATIADVHHLEPVNGRQQGPEAVVEGSIFQHPTDQVLFR